MYKVLTIAGSDCSGGAGIQADIKTIAAHKMYAMSVITALTAQNTTGVYGISDVGADFIAKQLDCVFCDIRPDAVKIGMVPNVSAIEAAADRLAEYKAENIVVDPVISATSGDALLRENSADALVKRLFPLADIVTPNVPEAELFAGISISSREDMLRAARLIAPHVKGGVLIKGGHMTGDAADLLYADGEARWLSAPRIDNPNTHGTGCTLSSAIACNLAAGLPLFEAVKNAKDYVTAAIGAMLSIGGGRGPLDHMCVWKNL